MYWFGNTRRFLFLWQSTFLSDHTGWHFYRIASTAERSRHMLARDGCAIQIRFSTFSASVYSDYNCLDERNYNEYYISQR